MNWKNGILIIGCLLIFTGCSNAVVSSKMTPKSETAQSASKSDSLSLKAEFFNKIKNVNGKNVIQNPTNILVLVNKNNSLTDRYVPYCIKPFVFTFYFYLNKQFLKFQLK